MQVLNNLDLLDEAVIQQQTRIREAAQAARGHAAAEETLHQHSIWVWIGDQVIAWGQSIRGGMPSRPMITDDRSRELAPLS